MARMKVITEAMLKTTGMISKAKATYQDDICYYGDDGRDYGV